jgi:hypothetical protein
MQNLIEKFIHSDVIGFMRRTSSVGGFDQILPGEMKTEVRESFYGPSFGDSWRGT